MKKYNLKFLYLIAMVTLVLSCNQTKKETMKVPDVEKKPKKLSIHNDVRTDNYYWLNERENPEVIDYLNRENAYTEAVMKDTEGLQDSLYKEIVARIKQDDQSVPYFLHGYWYYKRYETGKEYPIYCRKKGNLEAKEEILLEGNEMAKGLAYFQIGDYAISENNELLAYSVDTVSRRKYTIHIKNLKTGKLLKDVVKNTAGDIVWANDNKTFFYSMKDESLRPSMVYKHVLGTDTKKDELVFEEKDATFICMPMKSKSGKYIFIASSSTMSDEYRYIDANRPDSKFKVFYPRERGLEYDVCHHGNDFYILTNKDALDFRVMKTPVNKTDKKYWKEVIPHRKQTLIEDLSTYKNFFTIQERVNGQSELRILSYDGKTDFYISFDEDVYTVYFGYNPSYDASSVRFGYTSLTAPPKTMEYDLKSKKTKVLKETEVKGYNANEYVAERLFVPAADGTKIPVSMVYKKDAKKNRPMPFLLYAYGSYGNSLNPWFSYSRISLMNRGFAFAIAHIRGGEENGRQWYEDGKLLKKKNTFTDFNDVAQYLIDQKITSSDQLFAMGGSAGGLLMGAIINMKPELYKGVIAQVPFVDVVTTMLDESIPLTTGEFDEWGNPKEKKYYDYMLSYSPYDNVEAKDYPALLVTTGLHDSQVQYWEPAKWVAKLRDLKTDDNILLLQTNMDFGHSGASGRFESIKEVALEYAFMLKVLNEKK